MVCFSKRQDLICIALISLIFTRFSPHSFFYKPVDLLQSKYLSSVINSLLFVKVQGYTNFFFIRYITFCSLQEA